MKKWLIFSLGIISIFVIGIFIRGPIFLMYIEDDALRDEIKYEQKRLGISHPKLISELTIHKEVENFEGLEKLENLEKLIVNHTNNEKLQKINAQMNSNRLREVCIAFGEFDIDSSLTNLVNANKIWIRSVRFVDLDVFTTSPPKEVIIDSDSQCVIHKYVVEELKGQTNFDFCHFMV